MDDRLELLVVLPQDANRRPPQPETSTDGLTETSSRAVTGQPILFFNGPERAAGV
jgi:hypothetical protein